MKPQDLLEHILTQMTAEEALLKLLEGHVISYEKLKFDEGKEIHPIILISFAAMDLGWELAIEKDQKDVRGIMIGTREYMKAFFK